MMLPLHYVRLGLGDDITKVCLRFSAAGREP